MQDDAPFDQWFRLSPPPFGTTTVAGSRLGGPLPGSNGGESNEVAAVPSSINDDDDDIAGLVTDVYNQFKRVWPTTPLPESRRNTVPDFYQQFCDGTCEIGWRNTDDCLEFEFAVRLVGQEEPFVSIHYTVDTKESLEMARRLEAQGLQPPNDLKGKVHKFISWDESETNAQLTEDEQDLVFCLVPLRFLWEHGASFCKQHPKVFYEICCLEKDLVAKTRKKFSLTWCLLMTDVALTMDDNEFLLREGVITMTHVFQILGECFETRGYFTDAACVYEIGAALSTPGVMKGNLHNCAGLAFKRAQLYKHSEKQYLAAMREQILLPPPDGSGRPPTLRNLNDQICYHTMKNLLQMYMVWRINGKGSTAEPWISVLLDKNGYQPDPASTARAMCSHYGNKLILKKLTKEKATSHLIEALQCTNAKDYRAKLLELRVLGKPKVTEKPQLLPIPDHIHRMLSMQNAKETAKLMFRNEVTHMKYCGGPSCFKVQDALSERKFAQCSKCKSVSYCSRECQIEDWTTGHRKLCQHKQR